MKSNCKTKSAMTALVVAAMLCTAAMPVKAAESQWVNSNGTWSYVKEDGSKATGWIKEDGCWYAFDANGAMRTGWIASNEHWYFMGESGVMQSDAWVEDNGARYYIKGTGVMAKDYVKDGYELTSDGKAIPLTESNSVVVTDPAELEGKVIEGNLYVDVTTAKELELKGVTVKGKLVVLGDNKTAGKVTLTDSTVETINTQSRNAEVVLSGKTEVKNVVIEETAKVTPDKNYKGEVENIEVQSTTKGEVVIEVPAENVSTRTYATVDVQAPVGNLEVKTDTQVKVNADVKNVTVTETAKDTTVEVAKGSTVGTITADAPVKIDGKGTVEKVEANVDGVEAGKDTTIKEVETGKDVTEAPDVNKPSNGGSSSSGGGDYTPTPSYDYLVENEEQLIEYLNKATDGQVIKLKQDIELTKKIQVVNDASFTLDGNEKTITGVNTAGWNGEYVLQLYNNTKQITVKNLTLTGGDAGLLVNGANVKLEGTINVSGNEYGGIEVSQGEGVTNRASLDITNATLVNDNESMSNPTIWEENASDASVNNSKLAKVEYKEGDKNQTFYFIDINNAPIEVADSDELLAAMSKVVDGQPIKLKQDLTIDTNSLSVDKNFMFDLNEKTLTLSGEKILDYRENSITFKNGTILANDFANGQDPVFRPGEGASISLIDITMKTTGTALSPQGNAAKVHVENSNITAGVYVIGTNAADQSKYNVHIEIEGSHLTSTGSNGNGDDCAVIINVTGTLNIKKSTLTGNRQALIVRAGTANVTDTTLELTGDWISKNASDEKKYYKEVWESGNEVPSVAVVVGSHGNNEAYKAAAILTLNDCTIVNAEESVDIFMYGRDIYNAELITENEAFNISGNEFTKVNGKSLKTDELKISVVEVTPAPSEETSEIEEPATEQAADGTSTDESAE